MPNIRSQVIGPSGIYIQASNGAEFRLDFSDIRNFHIRQQGNPIQKLLATANWFRQSCVDILGSGQINIDRFDRLNFDIDNGKITDIRIRS